MLFEPIQDRGLEGVAADIQPIVAGALAAGVSAAEHILGDHRIAAATAAAFDQPGEQMLRASAVVQCQVIARLRSRLERQLALALLDEFPEVLVDDAKLRHVLYGPFAFRVEPRHAFACVGILEVAQTVPDQLTDIELVVEDAGSTFRIAMDGRRSPFAAVRAGHALAVQPHRDCSRRHAGQILRKNPADDIGLGFIDGALAAAGCAGLVELAHDVVAIAEAAARFAILDAPAQATPGLVGKVLQVKCAHRALEADMEFADFTLGQRDDADAGKAHALVEAGDILLVTGETIKGFRQNKVEPALETVGDQFLHARPQQ